ncbi:hypothetical protein ASPCADRAFT_211570, partial [Aspergillus carbonarius ITEM 5010]
MALDHFTLQATLEAFIVNLIQLLQVLLLGRWIEKEHWYVGASIPLLTIIFARFLYSSTL